jgi:DNA-binding NarL/FixJ family response regulator
LNHPLVSRASAIIGESSFVQGDLVDAEAAYKTAHEAAQTADDEAEALRGWALAAVQGERPDADLVVQRLAETKDHSALDLVRYATVELARRHFGSGFAGPLPEIEDASHVTPRVEDPRVRSSFRFFAAYVLAVGVKYREAAQLMELADEDIAAFDLDFARPHSLWNRALISLGQRRFGATERLLQLFEAAIAKRPLGYHALNGRMLRARLALQTGRSAEALQWLPICTRESAIPSIRGEYLATRALCFASQGLQSECLEAATAAEDITSAVEVRVLAAAARAITDTKDVVAAANEVWQLADQLGAWDPLVAAIRASQVLADAVAAIDELRPAIAELYEQTNDLGLARRAGLRLRSTRNPDEILSPRELEVLGLLAQGLRNRDVAEALVISESTTKVHVRHILEKLGVRTRAEAVARLGTVS